MLDHIDIHVEVPRVDYEKLSGDRLGESSESIRKRVQAARDIQQKRFANGKSDIICNADMRVGEIRQFCKLHNEGQSLMRAAMSQMNLSASAYYQILKLTSIIAALAAIENIQCTHLTYSGIVHPIETRIFLFEKFFYDRLKSFFFCVSLNALYLNWS